MAAKLYGGVRHPTTAQHPVQLTHAGGNPGRVLHINGVQGLHIRSRARVASLADVPRRFTAGAEPDFADGVPLLAGAALPLPLAVIGPALGADIGRLVFCHESIPPKKYRAPGRTSCQETEGR